MSNKFKMFILSGAGLAIFPAAALAQDLPLLAAAPFEAGSFFAAIIAGVLLAFAFQWLLTNLSFALGITGIGNIKEKANRSSRAGADGRGMPSAGAITTTLGIWAVVTMSVSLFFASWLAAKLSLVPSATIGVTLGLVIWAAFTAVMMYLEVRSVSTLAGMIWNTALNGIRSSFSAAQQVFSRPESRAEDIVRKGAAALREELLKGFDPHKAEKKLDEYVSRLEPKGGLDLKQARKEMAKLLNDLKIEESDAPESEGLSKTFFLKLAEKQPKLSRADVQKLGDLYDELKEASGSHERPSEKAAAVFDKVTPGSEEDSRAFREKVAKYLRDTRREELNPEGIKRDIDRIVHEPSSAKEVVVNRLRQFDTATLEAAVANRPDMNLQEANKILESVRTAIHLMREKEESAVGAVKEAAGSMADKAKDTVVQAKEKMEERVRDFFQFLKQPEFDYEGLKHDLAEMWHDPAASPEILKHRLSHYDHDTLVSLIASNPNVSRSSAERIAGKIEDTKNVVLRRAEETERKVKEKLEQAKQEALTQAERAREAAVAASWWLFTAAVVSGAASAVGGALALSL